MSAGARAIGAPARWPDPSALAQERASDLDEGAVRALAELVGQAGSVVALTGAGISVPSGIPDFRSPGKGIWELVDPAEVAHIDAFRRDPRRFWRFYGRRFASLQDKRPNGAHLALVELERRGALDAVITQNIDRLHASAGTSALVEVHGSIARADCLACGAGQPLAEVRERLAADPYGVPRCDCGQPLKPAVVLFGEMLPEARLRRAEALCARADLLLCVGSSLAVWPVAGLPAVTRAAGGRTAVITRGVTPEDAYAAVKLDADVVVALQELVSALR